MLLSVCLAAVAVLLHALRRPRRAARAIPVALVAVAVAAAAAAAVVAAPAAAVPLAAVFRRRAVGAVAAALFGRRFVGHVRQLLLKPAPLTFLGRREDGILYITAELFLSDLLMLEEKLDCCRRLQWWKKPSLCRWLPWCT